MMTLEQKNIYRKQNERQSLTDALLGTMKNIPYSLCLGMRKYKDTKSKTKKRQPSTAAVIEAKETSSCMMF